MTNAEFIQSLLLFVQTSFILIGGLFAGRTYLRDSRLKRAEWLERLHDKFFVSEGYKEIRRVLDYDSAEEFQAFVSIVDTKTYSREQELLVDYLNFFHFISILCKSGQIKRDEIQSLFGYYLLLLTKYEFIIDYMARERFYSLLDMLRSFGYTKKRTPRAR